MLAAALDYARRGIPVLPLHTPGPDGSCSCAQPRCDRPGKHPRLRHGLTGATTDPRQLDLWWSRWPEAGIGLRTGVVMDVADVDSDAGRQALAHLLADEPPVGPVAATGGGGWHLWFAPTGEGNRVGLLPGVDWRGAGGYVVAPPSRHASGRRYRWLRHPAFVATGACPARLRELLAGPARSQAPPAAPTPVRHPDRYAGAVLAAEAERVAYAVVGTRNDTLNRAAFSLGRLVGAGLLDESSVRRELTAAARRAGLGRGETQRTLRSGLVAGRRQPWGAPAHRAA